jgi:hypothetical protein
MILRMTDSNESVESPTTTLCKSCGLCCTGHLFAWTKLRSPELDPIEDLGVRVFREPHQRGFNQPCPLWDGICTIYDSYEYPKFCETYKCKLLKQVLGEVSPLPFALTVVQQTKDMIHTLSGLLPASSNPNFRERVVAHLESGDASSEFQRKAKELLEVFDERFGVDDFFDKPE